MIKIILLASYLLTAMMSWVPLSNHSFYEKEGDTLLRYSALALAMAEVSLEENRTPVFEGEDGRVRTALLLASIASTESGYEKTAVNCQRSGDNGIAWGAWQTHTDHRKTCSNLQTAAGFALNFVEISFHWCNKGNPLDRLAGYTTGRCQESWQSRSKISRAEKWYNTNKLEKVIIDEGDE